MKANILKASKLKKQQTILFYKFLWRKAKMTKKETIEILAIMRTSYPRFYQTTQSNEDVNATINLWYEMFQNDNASLVTLAVKSLIQTLEYPPTIADVKKEMSKMVGAVNNESLATDEWNAIKKALGNSIYGSEEEFEKLPPIAKRFVGSARQLRQWGMSEDFNSDVVKGQFLKQYETIKERQKYTELIQGNQRLKELLTNTAQNLLEG